jgi:PrtD family type I secretion system ABC transporter
MKPGKAHSLQKRPSLRWAMGQVYRRSPLLIGLGFIINLLYLTSPIYLMQVFDRVLASGRLETLAMLSLIAAVALAFMGLLEAVRGIILGRMAAWFEQSLGPEIVHLATEARRRGLSATGQPLRDLTTLRTCIGSTVVTGFLDLLWTPLFVVTLWLIHPLIGSVAIGAGVVLLAILLLNNLILRGPSKRANSTAAANLQQADLALRNADALIAMAMVPSFLKRWRQEAIRASRWQRIASDRNAAVHGLSKAVRLFVQIGVLGLGALLVLEGELTAGSIVAASILLGRGLGPLETMIGGWRTFTSAREAHGRLATLFAGVREAPPMMALPPPKGRLTCEGVSFVPRGASAPVLSGVNFRLEPGEALGIIGPSGAGKSTLCRLIVGIHQPTRGHVRLDEADIFHWAREDSGRFFGYLPQEIELVAGTVKENIARLASDPDPAAVVEAAEMAGVHEMVLRLPQGYETQIGEGGASLSGGQRQRIALARALFGSPRLIVMDEPNANLDADGETALVRAIFKAKERGATVVLVSHHPHLLKPADKLLVLRDGRAELFGKRDEVLGNLKMVKAEPSPGQAAARPAQKNLPAAGG